MFNARLKYDSSEVFFSESLHRWFSYPAASTLPQNLPPPWYQAPIEKLTWRCLAASSLSDANNQHQLLGCVSPGPLDKRQEAEDTVIWRLACPVAARASCGIIRVMQHVAGRVVSCRESRRLWAAWMFRQQTSFERPITVWFQRMSMHS